MVRENPNCGLKRESTKNDIKWAVFKKYSQFCIAHFNTALSVQTKEYETCSNNF